MVKLYRIYNRRETELHTCVDLWGVVGIENLAKD